MAFIECRDLHFSYSGESGEVLHGVDLDIEKGSFVALLGHNGCGKSTMAKLFNGMLVPTSGTVTVDGIDTAVEETQLDVRRRVGLVQQNPESRRQRADHRQQAGRRRMANCREKPSQ